MKWNRDEVIRLLDATIEDRGLDAGLQLSIIHFQDSRMRYELWITAEGIFLAADPERPVQGLPCLELSLPGTELAPFVRTGMPTGLGIYSGPAGTTAPRLSITRRADGSISLSGLWEGQPGILTAKKGAPVDIPPELG